MASAFDLLWTAFIFLFDVRVMGFDVLPDVIGYVLMAIGLRRLASLNKHLATAAKIAPIAALVSLADFYQPPAKGAPMLAFGGPSFKTPIGASLTVAGVILIVLNLLVVYHAVAGILQLAKSRKDNEVIESGDARWGEYKALHIALIPIVLFAALVPAVNWLAPLAQLAIGIVVYFGMMGFLRLAQWNLFGPESKTSSHK
jgi:hypothetical protein